MGRVEDAARQYNLIQGYQDTLEGRRGEFQDQRKGIAGFRQGLESWRTAPREDVGMARGVYSGMVSDESKRGYSPTALTGMRGRMADTLAGARRTTMEDLSRRVAASGMGRTGVGLRAGLDYGRDYARQQREGMRDIDIANETAKREDLFRSTQGLQDIQKSEDAFQATNYGMQGQTYDQNLQALQAETQLQALRASLYDPMNQMIALKNQPGFWKQFALNAAGGIGQAAGAYFGSR